jgi:uncharacterized protein (DUF697 family)/tellurite resistance protein
MLDTQQRAVTALALFAALADGRMSDEERQRIEATVRALAQEEPDLATVASDVFLGRTTLERAASEVTDPQLRRAAFDAAVAVCDSDGATGAEERRFLESLRAALHLPPEAARAIQEADALVARPPEEDFIDLLDRAATPPPPPPAVGLSTAAPTPQAEAIDGTINRYAMVAAALELLPQRLATVGILPLQMRMVYLIGKEHGHTLDRQHIAEFLGVVGVGMASQAVEKVARRVVGGMAKRLLGGMLGSLGGAATGAGMTYATTWALGQVARRYYASGRRLSAEQLREVFGTAVEQGKSIYQQQAPEIAARARNLDVRALLAGER